VILACLILVLEEGARAQAEATLSLEPATVSLAPGKRTAVDLAIRDASGVNGFEVFVHFDPAVIQVVDQDPDTPGVQVAAGDFFDVNQGFLVANQADNEAGEVIYAFTLLAPATPRQGDGILLSFEFEAAAVGQSQVILESAILASTDGEALPFSVQDGQVDVVGVGGETPLPTAPPVTPSETPGQVPQTPTGPATTPSETPAGTVPTLTAPSIMPSETPIGMLLTPSPTPALQPSATQGVHYTETTTPASSAPTTLPSSEAANRSEDTAPQPTVTATRTRLAVPVARPTTRADEEKSPVGLRAGWLCAVGLLGLLAVALAAGYFVRAGGKKERES
jgi:hypothetical protein